MFHAKVQTRKGSGNCRVFMYRAEGMLLSLGCVAHCNVRNVFLQGVKDLTTFKKLSNLIFARVFADDIRKFALFGLRSAVPGVSGLPIVIFFE
jgi:hypothetical protein